MKITEENFKKYELYALVTGAASGMGRQYSLKLASMGYNLVIVDINAAKLQETAELAKKQVEDAVEDFRKPYSSNFKVLPIVQDLSLKEAAANIALEADGCDVEVIVNNAGLLFVEEICNTPERMLDLMMMVHMYTPLMICRRFVPKMKERGNGYVLNISSLGEAMPWPVIGMYGNTKKFVKGFSRSLRIECQKTGVSVTNAYFGAVDTPLVPLPDKWRGLARNLGIMIRPEVAVEKALNATFKRKKGIMPGFINWLFYPLIKIMPDWLLGTLSRKLLWLRTKF